MRGYEHGDGMARAVETEEVLQQEIEHVESHDGRVGAGMRRISLGSLLRHGHEYRIYRVGIEIDERRQSVGRGHLLSPKRREEFVGIPMDDFLRGARYGYSLETKRTNRGEPVFIGTPGHKSALEGRPPGVSHEVEYAILRILVDSLPGAVGGYELRDALGIYHDGALGMDSDRGGIRGVSLELEALRLGMEISETGIHEPSALHGARGISGRAGRVFGGWHLGLGKKSV